MTTQLAKRNALVVALAQQWMARAKTLNLPSRGKRADEAAMHFFVGAMVGIAAVGTTEDGRFKALQLFVDWGVSIRGIAAVEAAAKEAESVE